MSFRHRILLSLCTLGLLAAVAGAAAAQGAENDAEALSLAARRGDVAKLRALLDKGVDVNTKFRYDATALFYACDRGYVEVVKLLLERGAEVNLRDKFYNSTPLSWAASPASIEAPTEAHVEIVKLLLAKGAQGADQVLVGAAQSGNLAMVRVVLGHGGLKPETLTSALATATTGKHQAVVDTLLAAGARPPFQVDAAILASYAGKYHSDQMDLELVVTEGKLIAVVGPQRIPLAATDNVTFQPEGTGGITLKFQVEAGKAAGFTLTQGATTTTFKRVEEKQ